MAEHRILIIEDESDLLRGLELNLKAEGYGVLTASRGDTGAEQALRERPELVLLDVMLPGMNGLDVCRELRRKGFQAPIIMLTARAEEVDRIVGLEIGADDYVTKPFSIRELMARIRARLRRHSGSEDSESKLKFEDVDVDFDKQEAVRGGIRIEMTGKEFEVLRLLARHRGEIVTRDRLLEEVWGYENYPTTRTVGQGRVSFYRVDLKTGEFREFLTRETDINNLAIALSPDEKTLYAAAYETKEHSAEIAAFDVATRQRRQVFAAPSNSAIHSLALSPDGRTLVFKIGGVKIEQQLYLVGVDGRNVRELYKPEITAPLLQGAQRDLAWTPDGLAILFILAGPNGDRQLMRMPIAGGKPEFTGLSAEQMSRIDPSSDGARIAFTDGERGISEVWAIDNLSSVLKAAR